MSEDMDARAFRPFAGIIAVAAGAPNVTLRIFACGEIVAAVAPNISCEVQRNIC